MTLPLSFKGGQGGGGGDTASLPTRPMTRGLGGAASGGDTMTRGGKVVRRKGVLGERIDTAFRQGTEGDGGGQNLGGTANP